MGVRCEHKVEKSMSKSIETGVEIKTSNVVGSISSGAARESSSGVGDDDGDSVKRGAGSIEIGRLDVSARDDKEDVVGDTRKNTVVECVNLCVKQIYTQLFKCDF